MLLDVLQKFLCVLTRARASKEICRYDQVIREQVLFSDCWERVSAGTRHAWTRDGITTESSESYMTWSQANGYQVIPAPRIKYSVYIQVPVVSFIFSISSAISCSNFILCCVHGYQMKHCWQEWVWFSARSKFSLSFLPNMFHLVPLDTIKNKSWTGNDRRTSGLRPPQYQTQQTGLLKWPVSP